MALNEGFTPVSANITELDPMCDGVPIITGPTDAVPRTVMTNSSGFGGTNVSVVMRAPVNAPTKPKPATASRKPRRSPARPPAA